MEIDVGMQIVIALGLMFVVPAGLLVFFKFKGND